MLFIRDGREKLTCKACMVSRFWFLVSVLPIRGMHRIQKQKRAFVFDINYETDWTEEVQKPKTKTRQKRRLKKKFRLFPYFTAKIRLNPLISRWITVHQTTVELTRYSRIELYQVPP